MILQTRIEIRDLLKPCLSITMNNLEFHTLQTKSLENCSSKNANCCISLFCESAHYANCMHLMLLNLIALRDTNTQNIRRRKSNLIYHTTTTTTRVPIISLRRKRKRKNVDLQADLNTKINTSQVHHTIIITTLLL